MRTLAFRRPLTPPAPRMADMSSSLGLAADTNLLALSSFFVTEGRLEEAEEEDDAEGMGGSWRFLPYIRGSTNFCVRPKGREGGTDGGKG